MKNNNIKLKGVRCYQREVFNMSEDLRTESKTTNKKEFVDWEKLNCKKLVYNKRLSGKFRLYLNDKMTYTRVFDILSGKKFIQH